MVFQLYHAYQPPNSSVYVHTLYIIVVCLFIPWDAILSKAPPCEHFVKYMGNPGKYLRFPGNMGKFCNDYNLYNSKMLKLCQKLNVQIYVFYKHFLACKNTLQACQTSAASLGSVHIAHDTVSHIYWKVTMTCWSSWTRSKLPFMTYIALAILCTAILQPTLPRHWSGGSAYSQKYSYMLTVFLCVS